MALWFPQALRCDFGIFDLSGVTRASTSPFIHHTAWGGGRGFTRLGLRCLLVGKGCGENLLSTFSSCLSVSGQERRLSSIWGQRAFLEWVTYVAASSSMVLPACCNVIEQVRSIWGLQRKSAILDLSSCSSWVSCCSACQPHYFLLERRVSGPVRKEGTSFGQLFSLKFWSTPLVGGTKLVWYCQRDSHSIRERINLLRFPPVTGLGAGKHESWVASSFGEEESSQTADIQLFYSWVSNQLTFFLSHFRVLI